VAAHTSITAQRTAKSRLVILFFRFFLVARLCFPEALAVIAEKKAGFLALSWKSAFPRLILSGLPVWASHNGDDSSGHCSGFSPDSLSAPSGLGRGITIFRVQNYKELKKHPKKRKENRLAIPNYYDEGRPEAAEGAPHENFSREIFSREAFPEKNLT
jgi:hypothetical protein